MTIHPNRSYRTFLPISAALLWALAIHAAAAVHMNREEALRAAFPGAVEFEKESLFLSEAERGRVEELARARVDSRLASVHKALGDDGELQGYAFIDSRTVRTKSATFVVALSPEGRVRATRILAWMEPPEYQPGERWLAQFKNHRLGDDVTLGRGIQPMSGASFSSRTLTDGVRRALALYRVKLANKE